MKRKQKLVNFNFLETELLKYLLIYEIRNNLPHDIFQV